MPIYISHSKKRLWLPWQRLEKTFFFLKKNCPPSAQPSLLESNPFPDDKEAICLGKRPDSSSFVQSRSSRVAELSRESRVDIEVSCSNSKLRNYASKNKSSKYQENEETVSRRRIYEEKGAGQRRYSAV